MLPCKQHILTGLAGFTVVPTAIFRAFTNKRRVPTQHYVPEEGRFLRESVSLKQLLWSFIRGGVKMINFPIQNNHNSGWSKVYLSYDEIDEILIREVY